jgi:hypothetical protein
MTLSRFTIHAIPPTKQPRPKPAMNSAESRQEAHLPSVLATVRQSWLQARQNHVPDARLCAIDDLADSVLIHDAESRLCARLDPRAEPRPRRCLCCGEMFDSLGAHNRRCLKCVRLVAYQHGAARLSAVVDPRLTFATRRT